MLQSKDTIKISELKNGFTPRWFEPDFILGSLKSFSFSSMCKVLNPLKKKGYNIDFILSCLVSLPFVGLKTVNAFKGSIMSQHIKACKDSFYRLKNNPLICWRSILWMFAIKFIRLCENQEDEQQKHPRCLIFDDSTLQKSGKRIEKVSRIWDHVSHSWILGFKLLVMGYWDGTSFVPFDFSLHRERGSNKEKPYGLKRKELRKQYNKKREHGSHSWQREKEADISKIDSALKMFWRAISQGVKVDYLLMDSWFTCDAFIQAVGKVKRQTVHLIGMYKTPKTKFSYNGEDLTHKQIMNNLGKAKRCRKLRLHYKEALVDFKGTPVKLFFSRQGLNGKWRVFIATDTEISFVRMIEIYQIRWTIEVFFKEAKQLLGLGKCQSNDFDAQIADTTISMMQYIMWTLRYRFDTYESKGALFDHIKETTVQLRLDQRLWGLFIELVNLIEQLFDGLDERELFVKMLNDENAYDKISHLFEKRLALKKIA